MSPLPATLRTVVHHGVMVRVLLAYAVFSLVEYAIWVAILLYAYAEGGVQLAGLVAVLQLLPAAVVAPALTGLVDRLPRSQALAVSRVGVALATGATTVALIAQAPVAVVVTGSAVATIMLAVARPIHFAALPRIAGTPDELVSANALSSVGEGIALCAGPALAGLGAQFAGPWLVFAGATVLSVAGIVLCVRSPMGAAPTVVEGGEAAWLEAFRGLAALWRDWGAIALLLVLTTRFVIGGALDVLGVSYSLEVLDMGESGAGLVIGSFGIGWLAGGALAGWASMRRRLAPVITASGVLQGVAFAVVAGMVLIAPVLVALALVGMASAVMMVAGRTLLQRSTDDGVLARVFAVQEGTALVGWAVGAAVARFLVERWGSADAFLALGAGVALFTVGGFALMRRLDARAVLRPQETALLRGVPFLSVLPAYELERLAQDAVWEDVPVGTVIVREGDVGDRFYVVGSGEFAVTRDDGTRLRAMGPGHGFGEIALMRSVPRTATVTAATDGRLLVISADDFLAVLTGSVDGTALAHEVSSAHLSRG